MEKLCQRQVATRATARKVPAAGLLRVMGPVAGASYRWHDGRVALDHRRCHKVDAEGGGASWRARIC